MPIPRICNTSKGYRYYDPAIIKTYVTMDVTFMGIETFLRRISAYQTKTDDEEQNCTTYEWITLVDHSEIYNRPSQAALQESLQGTFLQEVVQGTEGPLQDAIGPLQDTMGPSQDTTGPLQEATQNAARPLQEANIDYSLSPVLQTHSPKNYLEVSSLNGSQ